MDGQSAKEEDGQMSEEVESWVLPEDDQQNDAAMVVVALNVNVNVPLRI